MNRQNALLPARVGRIGQKRILTYRRGGYNLKSDVYRFILTTAENCCGPPRDNCYVRNTIVPLLTLLIVIGRVP